MNGCVAFVGTKSRLARKAKAALHGAKEEMAGGQLVEGVWHIFTSD